MPTLYTVIRRPLITEKGMTVKETQNTLVFEVALKATKPFIDAGEAAGYTRRPIALHSRGENARQPGMQRIPCQLLHQGFCSAEAIEQRLGLVAADRVAAVLENAQI